MNKLGICEDCKLRLGDYCFCNSDPDKLIGTTTKCDFFVDDSTSKYYEFIDGFTHCDKLKKQPNVEKIEKRAKISQTVKIAMKLMNIFPEDIEKQILCILIEEEKTLRGDKYER